jgi:hypothetical protein
MKKNAILTTSFSALICLLFFTACNKDDDAVEGRAKLQVYLTDDPGPYDAVKVDIQDVQIKHTGEAEAGWQSLPGVAKGIYNLLDLVDNKDTLLVDADVSPGKIQQIRLVLGDGNSIVVDGIETNLQTPSAQQSGLKLNIHQDVQDGFVYKLVLDFDASRSIVHTGSNKYILKPVIRTSLVTVGGSIRGVVVPYDSVTNVVAIQGTDTIAGTYTGEAGGYWIGGLEAGDYSLHFLPSANYGDTIRNNVKVINGNITVVDTLFLQ